jgi:predicted extracellular nuclease
MESSAGPSAWGLRAVWVVALFAGATASFGQIVITEIMQNPRLVSDTNGEWFELHNAGNTVVDINGWKIKDDSTSSETHTINKQGGLTIPAGGYIVLAEEGDSSTNGGITADYDYATINLGNSTDGLILTNDSDVEQDRVVWDNGSTFPDPNGASMALKAPDLDNSVGANWCEATTTYGSGDKGTPGAANDCPAAPIVPDPLSGEIYEIQTAAAESPQALGMATTNDNVVTVVGAGGFFIQTPTARSDGNVDTSDGIFVVHTGSPPIAVGDMVDVVGTVEEFFGFTRIDATATGGSVTVDSSNAVLPDPVEFSAVRPSADPASASCAIEYECYEGMRVRIALGTVASGSQHFRSDPVAEMYVTPTGSRAFREKGVAYPGVSGNTSIPVWDGNPEVFELDPDKLGLPNESWVPGTTFSATGVLGYEFGGWEFWPTELARKASGPSLPRGVRARSAGEVTVASLNVLNLREDASETKLGKLSSYVRGVLGSPDVIAVQEVYGQTALENLAARIKADAPNVNYTAHVEAPGGGSQAVGFLTRSDVTVNSVTEHGRSETFVDPRDSSVDTLHDRPPLLLDAAVGEFLELSVIVIHNRSLSGIDDAARGGWIRTKRLEQAQSVARLAQTLQTSKLLIVGDYNAYQFTDGYVDVVGQIAGSVTASENVLSGPDLVNPNLKNLVDDLPGSERYSFVFQGNAQALDHALVNQEMAGSVREMQYARGNADAAGADADRAGSPLAASDHDGFVVYVAAPGRPAPVAPGDPDGPTTPEVPEADLSLRSGSRVISDQLVRYHLSVHNAGPDEARNARVTSTLEAIGDFETLTGGCEEDPNGVPTCSLGRVSAGETVSFTIEVVLDGRSENLLVYRGSVDSDVLDPVPDDDSAETTTPLGAPPAPTALVATALNETEIELRWRDNSLTETEFAVFQQGPGDSKLRLIGTAPANSTSTIVTDLVPNVTYRFAVEARNGLLSSERTPKVTATTWTAETARCGEDGFLCLGRFQVEVEWKDGDGRIGRGRSKRLTSRSGDFWFFEPSNVELVVKLLDGCSINGHYWVFAVGLTDVAVTMTVRDLRTGSPFAGVPTSMFEKSWTSAGGAAFGPIADVAAFAACDAGVGAVGGRLNVLSGAPLGGFGETRSNGSQSSLSRLDGPVTAATCRADDTSLCLQDGRYQVNAHWRAGEESGVADGIPRTSDTGMFWFFSPDNIELVVKVLDGCGLNGHRWVVMGGLTDVGVEVTVRDTASDAAVKTYLNSEGEPFATRFDVTAFPCVVRR